jgi:ketosteroid isomerase-like protein
MALACAVSIAIGTGCGQTDQEQVREVTEDYIGAISKQDFAAACELFTDEYRTELGGDSGCARAQADQFTGPQGTSPELEIAGVRVRGDRANVALNVSRDGSPSPLALLMVAEDDDRWRIRGQQ